MSGPRYPCRVEVHHGSQWHTVAEFEVGNDSAESAAKAGIEALASLDPATAFRLVDLRSNRTVMNHSFQRGWTLGRGHDAPVQRATH